MDSQIEKYEQKIQLLKRVDSVVKEKVLYKPYKLRELDKKILIGFNKMSAQKLADNLKVNRSFIYATIEKFKNIYTKEEIGKPLPNTND